MHLKAFCLRVSGNSMLPEQDLKHFTIKQNTPTKQGLEEMSAQKADTTAETQDSLSGLNSRLPLQLRKTANWIDLQEGMEDQATTNSDQQ